MSQLLGIPLLPLVVHSAFTFLTNVPLDETPVTHPLVYDVPGVVVNIALI
jgi:hypothetical protein